MGLLRHIIIIVSAGVKVNELAENHFGMGIPKIQILHRLTLLLPFKKIIRNFSRLGQRTESKSDILAFLRRFFIKANEQIVTLDELILIRELSSSTTRTFGIFN